MNKYASTIMYRHVQTCIDTYMVIVKIQSSIGNNKQVQTSKGQTNVEQKGQVQITIDKIIGKNIRKNIQRQEYEQMTLQTFSWKKKGKREERCKN